MTDKILTSEVFCTHMNIAGFDIDNLDHIKYANGLIAWVHENCINNPEGLRGCGTLYKAHKKDYRYKDGPSRLRQWSGNAGLVAVFSTGIALVGYSDKIVTAIGSRYSTSYQNNTISEQLDYNQSYGSFAGIAIQCAGAVLSLGSFVAGAYLFHHSINRTNDIERNARFINAYSTWLCHGSSEQNYVDKIKVLERRHSKFATHILNEEIVFKSFVLDPRSPDSFCILS